MDIKFKGIKSALATTMAIVMATSATPAFAGVNIEDISSVNVVNAAVEEGIIDISKDINAKRGGVNIVNVDEANIVGSYIETLINSGTTTIDVNGTDVDITNLDATNICNSAITTAIIQKAKDIKVQEKIKGIMNR